MPDYIPASEGAFHEWITNFHSKLNATPANYGLEEGDLADFNAAFTAWSSARSAFQTAEVAFATASQTKQDARAAANGEARQLTAIIQADATVEDAARTAAGVPVRDTTKTPVGSPTTAPAATVDAGRRLQHTIQFRDDATPNSAAKPAGVRGAEIWMKIGDPAPTAQAQLQFVTVDSRTPHTIQFESADVGKTVHYWLRWVSTRNQPGPWGTPVSAMILG
jgi:hypothetical protein